MTSLIHCQVMKARIKKILNKSISLLGRHNWNFPRNTLVILTYHRILPDSDPRCRFEQPGMVVHPSTFEEHLSIIKEYFTIVPLSEWIHRATSGHPLPQRACAITFDDGWRDNYEYAFPILKKQQVPATIFLVSNLVGSLFDFWPGRLSRIIEYASKYHNEINWDESDLAWLNALLIDFPAISNSIIDREYIDKIICKAKHFSDVTINNKLDSLYKNSIFSNIHHRRVLLNWDESIEMCNTNLVELGSHTLNHVRLFGDISSDEMTNEIMLSKHMIYDHTKKSVNIFCYPDGVTCPQAVNIVKKHYLGACTTLRGWNRLTSNRYLLKRISIHQDSTDSRVAFLAKISGWI